MWSNANSIHWRIYAALGVGEISEILISIKSWSVHTFYIWHTITFRIPVFTLSAVWIQYCSYGRFYILVLPATKAHGAKKQPWRIWVNRPMPNHNKTHQPLQWRHNERDCVLNLFTQPFVQPQVKENIKAPRHWQLWGIFTGDRWNPRTKGQ